ncbi:hypothetical protein SFRURICE_007493 [Spodoptera frugiperda]|nr:hypothetical protein SFRURICE_007493 [Spodoptera frugiperda]
MTSQISCIAHTKFTCALTRIENPNEQQLGRKPARHDHLAWSEDPPFLRKLYSLFPKIYQAIVRPMRPRMSKTCSLVMIACIWISGMLLAIPCLLYSTTKEYRSKGTLKTACLLSWPDGLPDVSYMDFVYQVLFFVVTYAIPMLGMTFFYSAMGKVLWGSGSIGELTQRQVDSIRSKRKHMYLGFYWLAMANAMVNPIIYYWMNAK